MSYRTLQHFVGIDVVFLSSWLLGSYCVRCRNGSEFDQWKGTKLMKLQEHIREHGYS